MNEVRAVSTREDTVSLTVNGAAHSYCGDGLRGWPMYCATNSG